MENKRVLDVETYWMRFCDGESVVDQEALIKGFSFFMKGFGFTIVDDIQVFTDYDIDHDETRISIKARIVREQFKTPLPKGLNRIIIEEL